MDKKREFGIARFVNQQTLNPELLLTLYIFSFSILKPLTVTFRSVSTLILLSSTAAIVLAMLWFHRDKLSMPKILKLLTLTVSIGALFAVDFLFRNNALLFENAYHFGIYAVIPLFLLTFVDDYGRLLHYWCRVAVAMGILFLADPLLQYPWSGGIYGYMPFGFNHMMPAFFGAAVLVFYERKRWPLVFLALFFGELLIYANKGATLTAAVFLVILFVLFGFGHSGKMEMAQVRKRTKIILILAVVGLVLFMPAINILCEIMEYFNIRSYALNSIRYGGLERIIGMRTDIWVDVLQEFVKNPLFGTGIGTYEANAGLYPHNVFLEILSASGIVALAFFLGMLCESATLFFKRLEKRGMDGYNMFLLLYFVLWFFPMLISLTLWNHMPFWIYWGIYLFRSREGKRIQ